MSFKPIDDRQVVNRSALSNIGTPANASLDVILADINALLAGITNASGYVSKVISVPQGSTSYTATFPSQSDTSFIVLAMFENDIDSNPQFQQVIVTDKTTTSATFQWNVPLSTSNFKINFIVPFKISPIDEVSVPGSSSTVNPNLLISQNGSAYAIMGVIQNVVDVNPVFQTAIVTSQSATNFVESLNVPTNSTNYTLEYLSSPTGQLSIGLGASSQVISVPVPYGTVNYAVMAVMSDLTDPHPRFQPLVITSKSSSQFTISWPIPTESANYVLTYYVLSVTP